MKRQNRLWGTLLLGAVVLAGWIAFTGANRTSPRAAADAETMLRAADRLYPSGYAATVQHSGPYLNAKGDAAFASLGDGMAARFGLPASKPVRDANGHPVYRASGESPSVAGAKLEVALSGWADGTTNLIVRLDAPEGTEKDKLLAWTADAAARLEPAGVQPKWMITLRGGAGALSDASLKALKAKVAGAFKADPAESYSDSGSEIISYTSRLLGTGVRSAGGTINLQAAFHRDSVYGTYKLTIATPLIVAEP
ncbi:YwmB family TATA-box binding protein [Paenibacillus sp. GYB003]|uniref:YwmB family TATA-box binding protein n=1 Tax=Paenibacillus sp. GYB003 TaxID=2994392 RepID=UPI002F96E026